MTTGVAADGGLAWRLLWMARDIKLSHSLFALPFALLALFLACAWRNDLPTAEELGLIVLCMVLARTSAMAFNRWADADIDTENARTAGRAIPSGKLRRGFVLWVVAVTSAAFVAAASGFGFLEGNWWPVALSPLALAWILGYSYTKRFTSLCHLALGGALALSPLAASLAVAPGFLRRPDVYWLAGMVVCWVSGFDVIYSLADLQVDRAKGLHSLPAWLGVERALGLSAILHGLAIACLAALLWVSPHLGSWFAGATVVIALVLVLEHVLVWRSPQRRLLAGFTSLNGAVSLIAAGAGIGETWMHVGIA